MENSSSASKIKILSIVLFIILIGLISVYFYYSNKKSHLSINTNQNATTTTTSIGGVTVAATGSGGATIEQVPIETTTVSPPSLDRPITFTAGFPKDAQDILTVKITDLEASLKKNPASFDNWILLGVDRKIAGDFIGAKEAWIYASLIRPVNVVANNNLGTLSQYNLKDYPQAEKSFLKAVSSDPAYIQSYLNLHDLYRYSYMTESSKAADILKQGLRSNPNSIDLLGALANYYKVEGDSASAKVYYNLALTQAQKLNNQGLITSIQGELAKLK